LAEKNVQLVELEKQVATMNWRNSRLFGKTNTMRKTLIFAALFLFLGSCGIQPTPKPNIHYLSLGQQPESSPDKSMHLFWNSEVITGSYKKIGRMEVRGNHADSILLDFLQWKAHEVNANGIIGIEKTIHQEIIHEASPGQAPQYKTETILSGIAVEIQKDSAFIVRYGNGMDNGYFERVMAWKEPKKTDPALKVMGTMAILGICTWYFVNELEK
jgi:hypothetical protein